MSRAILQDDPPDLKKAFFLHQAGQFDKAANIYREILASNADNSDALHGLGLLEARAGNLERAKSLISRSLELQPENTQFRQNYATILCQTAHYGLALQTCDEALRSAPNNIYLLYVSAIALLKLKRLPESLQRFDELLTVQPDHLVANNERGCVLAEMKHYDMALAAFQRALRLDPNFAGAHLNMGSLFGELERHEEAKSSFQKALALNPRLARAWSGIGNILRKRRLFDEALAAFDKALALEIDLVEASIGRGNVFTQLKRYDEAFAAYDKALSIEPDLAEAWIGRGNVFTEAKRYDEAFAAYDKALSINPDLVEAWLGRGNLLFQLNRTDEAIADFRRAAVIKPDYAVARFAACFAELPILYTDEQEIIPRREAYAQKLRALCHDVETGNVQGDLARAIEFKLPFLLAYQGYNDCDLQALYGLLICHIMEHKYPAAPLPRPPSLDETVRVGVVSAFFHRHPVWNLLVKGWIGQLDRKRFKVFGYHIGTVRDSQTDIAAAICDRFVHRDLTVEKWRQEILADAPHVLIYPGQLMDSISVQLAGQRLALVQCNSWGHPETSGMSTLDYFLSSDLMEPPDAQQHYTEKLVRLPNLSIYYEPTDMDAPKMSRDELGLRSDATVFWCGQSLFKYLPQFDVVFARIAEKVPNCQFVFIQYPDAARISELFKERLDRAFATFGLSAADHYVLLPRLSPEKFIGAIGQCDLVLDSFPWSGGNSTLETLSHNLPIVTMQSRLMRGRHSAALLRMMGIAETITHTVEDYIATAVRVANDPDERRALSRKVADNKHRLYRDRQCIVALENFIDCVARPR